MEIPSQFGPTIPAVPVTPINQTTQSTIVPDITRADKNFIHKIRVDTPNYLTHRQLKDLHKRMQQARPLWQVATTIENKAKIIEMYFMPQKLNRLKKYLRKIFGSVNQDYLNHSVLQCFVQDSKTGNYTNTRRLIDQLQPNFMIGVFEIPYSEKLKKPSLELLTFTVKPVENSLILEHGQSNAIAITDVVTSPGFAEDGTIVAVFGENWVQNSQYKHDPEAKARYFVDKFSQRVEKYTEPILKHHVKAGTFRFLEAATPQELEAAASHWLYLHEDLHSQGVLPWVNRKKHLSQHNREYGHKIKNTQVGGAFEEGRVDLGAILKAHDDAEASKQENRESLFGSYRLAQITKELILVERLLRYAVQKNPKDNFDAITSHIFLNYLRKHKAIEIDSNNVLSLDHDKVIKTLAQLHQEMVEVELSIDGRDLNQPTERTKARQEITAFVDKWVPRENHDRPEEKPIYRLDPFYARIRETLKIQI